MTELSNRIINDFTMRKTFEQKSKFIDLIKENYNCKIQTKGKTRNIIIGDVEKAKTVYSAHYDTPATIPFPNAITPQNILFFILYQFLIAMIMILPGFIIGSVIDKYSDIYIGPYEIGTLIFIVITLGIIFLLKNGPANKNNYNDNTSGVITLIELMDNLSGKEKENCLFVFFDDEEKGLVGSRHFKKTYKELLNNFLLINIDCVGDGNNTLFIYNKQARNEYKERVNKHFTNTQTMNFIEEKKLQIYPSDQIGYKKTIAICTLKKNRILGYYVDKIHTNKDLTLKNENIEYLVNGFVSYQKELSEISN